MIVAPAAGQRGRILGRTPGGWCGPPVCQSPMKAIGYLRELPEPTLEVQQRAFLDYCAGAGLEVGQTFTETADAGTAGDPGSPEFRRMLRLLQREQPGFTVIVVAGLLAFGPRVRDQALRYLQLAAVGLPLHLADGVDVEAALLRAWDDRGPQQRRRERARESMRNRALHGEVLGRPPYGYRAAERHLELDPPEAEVVREIFRACVEHDEGVRRIARRLNDAGHLTRRGGPWSTVSVRDILRNPVYVGTYRRLGIVVPGAHESIVDRAQFDRVQALMAERRTTPGRQQRRQYLLAGLARCGYCDNRLIGVRRARRNAAGPAAGEYIYYQCESRTNQGRCAYHTRRAEELEATVRQRVAAYGGDEHDAHDGATRADEDGRQRQQRHDEAGRRARQRELDRMLERYAAGQWTAQQLRSSAAALVLTDLDEEERAAALARGETQEREDAGRARMLVRARARLSERWEALEFDERRDLLRRVVTEVMVTDEEVRMRFAR